MMVNKLKNPIKEIILSVSFDKNLDIGKLKSFCEKELLKKDFPIFKPGYDAKLKIDEPPYSEFNHTGYIFRSNDDVKNILNIKIGKISYHIIDRYESFDLLLDKLDEYWSVLQSFFGKLDITNISARYINQLQVSVGENYEKYIKVKIDAPFDNIQGQFINFSLTPSGQNFDIKTNVIIANDRNKNLILDIIVEKRIEKLVLKNISDIFIELRPIKNNIFEQLITKETKEKFDML